MRCLRKVTISLTAIGVSYIKVEILKTKETEFQRESQVSKQITYALTRSQVVIKTHTVS